MPARLANFPDLSPEQSHDIYCPDINDEGELKSASMSWSTIAQD
jgi:hypothetical protein